MAVFGVDFGNLNSVVSVARKGGIDIIVNEVSKRETSSMVSFGEKERFLGEKAADLTIRNWQNTVTTLKRLVGVKYDSPAAQHELKFVKTQTRPDANGFIEFKVQYKWQEHWFKPEELIGMLFTNLRSQAEREAAEDAKVEPGTIKVVDCVVSCPVYFTAFQRKLLHQSLQIAGLNPLALLNETTAAALDWGIFKTGSLPEDEANSVVTAFVDIGHSATTCTLASFMKGQLKVLGHVYDAFLGVRDFDYVMFEHFAKEVQAKHRQDVKESKKSALKFMQALEKLKKVLSANQVAALACEMGEYDVNIPNVTREMTEELWAPLVAKLKDLFRQCVALTTADRISAVEIIGGGSRIPCVKAAVAEIFNKPVQTTLNASESIAKGCGIMGAMLSPKFKVREFGVVDVNIHTINIGYYSDTTQNPIQDPHFPEINKKMVVLRPGDACPKTLNLTFDRTHDFDLFVFYEENPDLQATSSELLIGKWKIGAIPSLSVQPAPPVKVKLRINPSMLINVEGASVTEEYETEEIVEEKVPKAATETKPADAPKPEGGPTSPTEKKDGAAPMETDEKPKEEAKEEVIKKVVKKKNTKKHDCTVTILKTTGHSQDALNDMRGRETQMIESDLNVQKTLEAKNAVEAYVYDMRGKINEGGIYFDFIAAKDRDGFTAAMTKAEDWLYGDGSDTAKDEYIQKLVELKKFGNPIINRFNERKALPSAVLALKGKCNELKAQAENKDGKLAHIPVEELQSVISKVEEFATWLNNEVSKSSAVPLSQDPTLLAATVIAKQKELESFCTPILTKPKPKEEKKPEPAPAATSGATGAEGKTSPPPAQNGPASPTNPEAQKKQPGMDKMDLD